MAFKHLKFRSVQKLYSLRDSLRVFTKMKKREVSLNQLPLFFLARGFGLSRLEIVSNGGLSINRQSAEYQRTSLKGIRSSKEKRIIYRLPNGTNIEIRPYHSNPLYFRDCKEYEFNLGKNVQNLFSCLK